jgi:hypothetical protein
MFLLGVGVASVAEAQIGLAGASDADWTVLTVAPDGAWGTSTEGYLNRAIADAIQRCRAMSRSTLGCGAYQVSVQAGWALASRCGRENILAKGATLAEATESARQRELELRRLYQPAMESCRQLVVVAPDGSVKAPEPQAIASDSSRGRWIMRLGLTVAGRQAARLRYFILVSAALGLVALIAGSELAHATPLGESDGVARQPDSMPPQTIETNASVSGIERSDCLVGNAAFRSKLGR